HVPDGYLLPFPLHTSQTRAGCIPDVAHDWVTQHLSWRGGAMDGFAASHLAGDPRNGRGAMGYYEREDLPFYYALADAFTLCDAYHCSALGLTDPNRLYTM